MVSVPVKERREVIRIHNPNSGRKNIYLGPLWFSRSSKPTLAKITFTLYIEILGHPYFLQSIQQQTRSRFAHARLLIFNYGSRSLLYADYFDKQIVETHKRVNPLVFIPPQ